MTQETESSPPPQTAPVASEPGGAMWLRTGYILFCGAGLILNGVMFMGATSLQKAQLLENPELLASTGLVGMFLFSLASFTISPKLHHTVADSFGCLGIVSVALAASGITLLGPEWVKNPVNGAVLGALLFFACLRSRSRGG